MELENIFLILKLYSNQRNWIRGNSWVRLRWKPMNTLRLKPVQPLQGDHRVCSGNSKFGQCSDPRAASSKASQTEADKIFRSDPQTSWTYLEPMNQGKTSFRTSNCMCQHWTLLPARQESWYVSFLVVKKHMRPSFPWLMLNLCALARLHIVAGCEWQQLNQVLPNATWEMCHDLSLLGNINVRTNTHCNMHCVIVHLKAKSARNDGMVTSKATRQWLQGGGTSSLHIAGGMDHVHPASRITF